MINTVTIPVSEYDNLRKQREEVIRLKEIKEPELQTNLNPIIQIIIKKERHSFDDGMIYQVWCDVLSSYNYEEGDDFDKLIKEIELKVNENNGVVAELTKCRSIITELQKKLDRIPNWIKKLFI